MSRSFARLFPGARHARRSGSGLGRLPNPADAARRLEHAEALDGTVRVLADAVQRQTGSGAKADALHGVWLGQPVHPALDRVWAFRATCTFSFEPTVLTP